MISKSAPKNLSVAKVMISKVDGLIEFFFSVMDFRSLKFIIDINECTVTFSSTVPVKTVLNRA